MNSLISVILPIYNGEKYINNLFNSMKNQTISFDNLELIFINNKSTDNSLEILNSLSEKYENIKIINLEKHYPTPGHSRNMGIIEASSEFIMFCDGDDVYTPDFCKTMYDTITKESVDLVSTRYTVNVENKENYLNNSFLNSYEPVIKINSINEFSKIIQTQANLTIWNKIYRKDYLIKNNIKFVEEHWAEDFLFSLESYIKAKGIVLLTDYSGYLYTVIDDSQSHKQPPREDYYNNGIIPLKKGEKLLTDNNMEVMPYVSEFIVSWIKIFLESNLADNELSEIYQDFKPWLKRYSITTRLVNLPVYINIPINIAVKLFSHSKHSMLLTNKILKK